MQRTYKTRVWLAIPLSALLVFAGACTEEGDAGGETDPSPDVGATTVEDVPLGGTEDPIIEETEEP